MIPLCKNGTSSVDKEHEKCFQRSGFQITGVLLLLLVSSHELRHFSETRIRKNSQSINVAGVLYRIPYRIPTISLSPWNIHSPDDAVRRPSPRVSCLKLESLEKSTSKKPGLCVCSSSSRESSLRAPESVRWGNT